MNNNIINDVSNVTMAEIHVAINNTEKGFFEAVRNKNYEDAIGLAKRYIELNKLLSKRSSYAKKNDINGYDEKSEDIQIEIGREVERIMNGGRSK